VITALQHCTSFDNNKLSVMETNWPWSRKTHKRCNDTIYLMCTHTHTRAQPDSAHSESADLHQGIQPQPSDKQFKSRFLD